MKRLSTLFAILFFMAGSAITAQNIIYVTPNGTGNGSSWATATDNLQAAIGSAATQTPKPDIWVAAGTYYGDSISTHNAFTMADGVNVYGGFAGNEPANYDLALRDFETNETVLDGQHVQRVLYQAAGFTDTTTWDGFTIRNGKARTDGGGAYLYSKSVLNHCKITNNNSNGGGGVYAYQSIINNSNITNNSVFGYISDGGGGGILAQYSTLTNCNITNNTSDDQNGGGVYASSSTLTNCNIIDNSVDESGFHVSGGGVYASMSILNNCNIKNSTITSNLGWSVSIYGAGIHACNYSTLTNCSITNNTSTGYSVEGGGVYTTSSTLINCEIKNNVANGTNTNGGGVYASSSTLTNCNTNNNVANGTNPNGGGVYASSSTLTNCNTNNNVANGTNTNGGGVYASNSTLTNCLVWGNRYNQISNDNNSSFITYCAVEGGYVGEGNVYLESENSGNSLFYPRFVNPSQIAGIDTVTQNIDWHLQEGSICINRGNSAAVSDTTDLSGNMRIQHDTVDIGCYESSYQGVMLPIYSDSIVYVIEGGNGSMNGTSWNNAMSKIQQALAIASLQDNLKIWVAAGIYYGDSIATSNAFTMTNGINVYGGFAGNEPANYDLSLRDFETNETILDGQHVQRVLYQAADFTDTTMWDGFTIRNGNRTYYSDNGYRNGGGAYLRAKSVLSHCNITNNTSSDAGGGVYAKSTTLTNCNISNNTSRDGGGVCVLSSTLTNCNISNNTSRYRSGGGVYASNSTLTNCIIWGNKDGTQPDNIYNSNNSSTISYCAVEGGYGGNENVYLESENRGNGLFYPRFANPSQIAGIDTITQNIDWHLQAGSICINKGNNTAVNDSTDLSGNVRIQHDTVDIGCYESSFNGISVNSPYTDDIVYVTENGQGNMDGTSWNNAMPRIQDALKNALQYHVNKIYVTAGTYYGDSIATHNAFTMTNGVDVYGGFAGNEPANYNLALRDFVTNETVLDGQNVQRVLYQADNFTDTTTWDGFTIRNGKVGYFGDGGGAFLNKKSVLSHCNITNNTCGQYGGGVYAESTTLTNCNISNNTSRYGGGVYVLSSTLTNCNISNNTSSLYGGGVYAESTTLTNCNISNNTSSDDGGGVYAKSGVYAESTMLTNCNITNNTSSDRGGGVYAESTMLTNCNITNNTSSDRGGGVYANSVSQFINCDIVNNKSSSNGGGVYNYSSINTYKNCIIWGNKRGSTANQIYGSATFTYCAIEGGCTGTGNINLSADNIGAELHPYFVNPSAIAGVDTVTQNINWQLQSGSACIDAGDTTVTNLPITDLAGRLRIINGRVDIGVYEYTDCIVTSNLAATVCQGQPYNENGFNIPADSTQTAGTRIETQNFVSLQSGCDSTVILTLTVNPSPTVTISGNTEIHAGESTTLTASGAIDYLWSTMETTPSILVTPTDTTLYSVIGTDENGCVGYDTVIVNVATGIADYYDLSNNILLFPNPATNTVELQITNDKLQIIEIEVMDMMGKLVKTTHALNPQSATINVSVLAAGTYFVRVTTSDGNVVTKKLVKK